MEFEEEFELRGSYAEQPAYVRVTCWLAYLSCVDLLIFIPIAAGAAIVAGVGTPASSQLGNYLPFVILFGMLAIGAWMNQLWLGWLPGHQLNHGWRWAVFATLCAASVAASTAMIVAHRFSILFLWSLIFVPFGLICMFGATQIKQACSRRGWTTRFSR